LQGFTQIEGTVQSVKIPADPWLRLSVACLLSSNRARQCRTQLIGLKTKGTWFALISDAAVGIDQIKAIGPTSVCTLRPIAKLIENAGNLYTELAHAGSGDVCALFFVLRVGEDHLIFYIALHLPDVAGVGFSDVNHEKGNTILVLLVKFVEGRNLPPEWRSSVTAEDQHDRLLLVQEGELNPFGLVDFKQGEVRRRIADLQSSGAGMKPGSFEWEEQEGDRPGQSLHYPPEGLRGLIHRPPDGASEGNVGDHQHDGSYTQALTHNRA
jgi:hypothetical protein